MVKKIEELEGNINAQNFINQKARENKKTNSKYNFIYMLRNASGSYSIYLSIAKPSKFFFGKVYGKQSK